MLLKVYSPYRKLWEKTVNSNVALYLTEAEYPLANEPSMTQHPVYGALFVTPVPTAILGFQLDEADRLRMIEWWPAGEDAAREVRILVALFVSYAVDLLREPRFYSVSWVRRPDPLR